MNTTGLTKNSLLLSPHHQRYFELYFRRRFGGYPAVYHRGTASSAISRAQGPNEPPRRGRRIARRTVSCCDSIRKNQFRVNIKRNEFVGKIKTHSSHSSSVTYISSYCSYLATPRSSPHQTCRRNRGFAQKSGLSGLDGSGGNRRTSLKSIEFPEGGFHFRLHKREDAN